MLTALSFFAALYLRSVFVHLIAGLFYFGSSRPKANMLMSFYRQIRAANVKLAHRSVDGATIIGNDVES